MRTTPTRSRRSHREGGLRPAPCLRPLIGRNALRSTGLVALRGDLDHGNSVSKEGLGDSKASVEAGRLYPVLPEDLLRPGRARNRRAGRLDAPSQVAQPPLRGALIRYSRVVREAARDLQEAELPRRGRDLLRV